MSYGFEVFDNNGNLFIQSSDITARWIGEWYVNADDNNRTISISGITTDNCAIAVSPGTYTKDGTDFRYYPTKAAVNGGSITVSGAGVSGISHKAKAQITVYRIK